MTKNKCDKPSFLIYKSFYPPIKDLSDEHLGELFRAIFLFQIEGKIPNLSDRVRMAFDFFKNQFCVDNEKYEERCRINSENANARWKKQRKESNASNSMQLYALDAKDADIDKELDKELDIDKEIEKTDKHQLPTFIEPDVWNGFVEMRKLIKKPLTKLAIKGIIKKLEVFESRKIGNASLALRNSIESSWAGVFEPKSDVVGPHGIKGSNSATYETLSSFVNSDVEVLK